LLRLRRSGNLEVSPLAKSKKLAVVFLHNLELRSNGLPYRRAESRNPTGKTVDLVG